VLLRQFVHRQFSKVRKKSELSLSLYGLVQFMTCRRGSNYGRSCNISENNNVSNLRRASKQTEQGFTYGEVFRALVESGFPLWRMFWTIEDQKHDEVS
jgi:hypothetical protein